MQSPRVLVAGETLVDLFPVDDGGGTRTAGTFERRAGGAPANVAVAPALGCATGALTTTAAGATPSPPDRDSVERFVEERSG